MTDPIEHGGSHWPSEVRLFIDNLQRELQEQRNQVALLTASHKELMADVGRLNQMMRDTGQGQGAIDAYVAQCEELDRLRGLLRKVVMWHGKGGDRYCSLCGSYEGIGHATNCEYAAALKTGGPSDAK